jgi:precorrin-3B methylase
MERKWLEHTEYHPGIRIHRVPVQGVPGLLFVAAILLLVGAPVARDFLMIAGAAGLGGAGILYWWHNQTRW